MEGLDINNVFGREQLEHELGQEIARIWENPKDIRMSKGIFVTGPAGCGKTTFVLSALERLGYDAMTIDAGDVRNKEMMARLASGNIAERSVLSMFHGPGRPVVIVLDDIDCLSAGGGDKGASGVLVKLIRPQKSRRQIGHPRVSNPVICIGSDSQDKKTREIVAACAAQISLSAPSVSEMDAWIQYKLPDISPSSRMSIVDFANGDLHQLQLACSLVEDGDVQECVVECISKIPYLDPSEDSRQLATRMLKYSCSIEQHARHVSEADRTILGLSLHENIPRVLRDCLSPSYLNIAVLFSDADCLDRTGFQNQVPQLSELSSIIKNIWTTCILQSSALDRKTLDRVLSDIRFTRVLTKYSSEYNNMKFIQTLCTRTGLEKKDLFRVWRTTPAKKFKEDEELGYLAMTPLELNRLGRYFDFPVLVDETGSL